MARCEECIHEKVCVIKAFPDAFENTEWEIKPCNHFKYNNELAPMVLNEVKRFYADGITERVNSTDANVAKTKHIKLSSSLERGINEFAEEIKLEFYREFDEIIPSIMADKIDELKKKYTEGK